MTSSSGDGKSLRQVASWPWLISAAAGLRNRKGLFFKTGRTELRVDCLVCGQDAALVRPGTPAIASPVIFLSMDDGVCDGRLVVSVSTSVIVLVCSRI